MKKLNLKNVKENLNELIKDYNICVNNNHCLFDGDLEELFADSNITIGNTLCKAMPWSYDDDDWLTGCCDGDYLETIELIQDNNVYHCQAFSDCCGDGLDYTLALANVSLAHEAITIPNKGFQHQTQACEDHFEEMNDYLDNTMSV